MSVQSGWYVVKCRWHLQPEGDVSPPVEWHFEGRAPIVALGPVAAESVAQELYDRIGAEWVFGERDAQLHQLALVFVEARKRGTVQRLLHLSSTGIADPTYRFCTDVIQLAQLLTVPEIDQLTTEVVQCLHLSRQPSSPATLIV